MEVCIVPSQTAGLIRLPINDPKIRTHIHQLNVQICKEPGAVNDSEQRFSSMITNSLANASVIECKRQKRDPNPDTSVGIFIAFDLETGSSGILIGNKLVDRNTWFSRLERVCGGVDQFTLDVDLTLFSVEDDKHKVEVRGKRIGGPAYYAGLHYLFTTPLDLLQKWETAPRLSATLSVKVKLSDEAVERVFLDNMDNPFVVNKSMLMDSSTSDVVLVAANGEQVKCHKGFLSAHSDVFKVMFESELKSERPTTIQLPEMSEASVRALLSYLYCWELKEISKSSSIALELLVAADKYNIPKLVDSSRDLILLKKNEWFTPSVTVRLLQFARNKGNLGEEQKYKPIKDKCIMVLKSIPKNDLQECLDYQNLFADQQAAMELFSYLLYA